MQLSHYEPVPPPIQKDLVAQYQATRKQAEED
jgi:hypothetical protein